MLLQRAARDAAQARDFIDLPGAAGISLEEINGFLHIAWEAVGRACRASPTLGLSARPGTRRMNQLPTTRFGRKSDNRFASWIA